MILSRFFWGAISAPDEKPESVDTQLGFCAKYEGIDPEGNLPERSRLCQEAFAQRDRQQRLGDYAEVALKLTDDKSSEYEICQELKMTDLMLRAIERGNPQSITTLRSKIGAGAYGIAALGFDNFEEGMLDVSNRKKTNTSDKAYVIGELIDQVQKLTDQPTVFAWKPETRPIHGVLTVSRERIRDSEGQEAGPSRRMEIPSKKIEPKEGRPACVGLDAR